MNHTATACAHNEEALFGDEVSDQALENAAGAGRYSLSFCNPTDRCTAPATPPLHRESGTHAALEEAR